MSRYATPKFRPDQKVIVEGKEGTVRRVCGRKTWASPQIPEFRVRFPNGERVVRESDLAPAPVLQEPNGQVQGGTAAAKTALPTTPILAAARRAMHTSQVVVLPALAEVEPADGEWPKPPIKATTYDYFGARRPSG